MLPLQIGCALTALLYGCAAPPEVPVSESNAPDEPYSVPDDGRPHLALTAVEDGDSVVATVSFTASESTPHPRMAELLLEHRGLTVESFEPGQSVIEADKQLVVQGRQNGHSRIVVFSSDNALRLATGTLADLRLRRVANDATLSLVPSHPMLAPTEAADGLIIDDPPVLSSRP